MVKEERCCLRLGPGDFFHTIMKDQLRSDSVTTTKAVGAGSGQTQPTSATS